MFNKKEFCRTIEDAGYTLKDVADKLGICVPSLYRKMNGQSDFYRNEIVKIAELIGFEKIGIIFFNSSVA